MAQPNSNFDEILTTTLKKYSASMADNVLENNTLLRYLKSKGQVVIEDGGYSLLEGIQFDENDSFKYYSGYETLDLTRNDVQATIRADDVYETTPLPAGHPLQNIRRRFAKKYPNAIVGVQTKDGREVFFNEPLPPEYGPVITYEQFSAIEKAREARERGTRGW